MKLTENSEYQKWLNEDRILNLRQAEYTKEQKAKKEEAKQLRHAYHQKGIYTRISVREKKKLRRWDLSPDKL